MLNVSQNSLTQNMCLLDTVKAIISLSMEILFKGKVNHLSYENNYVHLQFLPPKDSVFHR